MIPRALMALTLVLLAGCSGQRGQPQVTANGQPTATLPSDPQSEAQPVVAVQLPASSMASGDSRLAPANVPNPGAGMPIIADTQPLGPPVTSAVSAAEPPPPAAEPINEDPNPPSRDGARTIVVPSGTRIRVRLDQTLDTRFSRAGSIFDATLVEPIVEGGRVVVPRHTRFVGTVVAAKRSGRFRGRAYMHVTLRSFRLNGVKYRIATAPDSRASGSHKKRNLALVGGGSATGAGIGAIAGGGAGALIGAGVGAAAGATTEFITGKKDVRLPAETPMVFSLRFPIQVKPA
jgi:hypothetical protein